MTQRPAIYSAHLVTLNSARFSQQIARPVEFWTRRELVAWVDYVLDCQGFSGRARRQVSMPIVWRIIQRRGSGHHASFIIESTAPCDRAAIQFQCHKLE